MRPSPHGKSLEYADLSHQDLSFMDLSGAKIREANLAGSNLTGADLSEADLTKANLSGADLTGANLNSANFSWADMTKAKLKDIQAKGTKFYSANLSLADLRDVDLSGADLSRVSLVGADLTGAQLIAPYLRSIDYTAQTQWPAGFTPPKSRRSSPQQLYGSLTGPQIKLDRLLAAGGKTRARDFKRDHPHDFDVLTQHKLSSDDFSTKRLDELKSISKTPFNWYITISSYNDDRYVLCSDGALVIKLNIDLNEVNFNKQEREALRDLSRRALYTNHPYEDEPLINIGWILLCVDKDNKTYLIEEVQSAIPVDSRSQWFEFMKPYTDRFFEDAVGFILNTAAKEGFEVEILSHTTKHQIHPRIPTYPYRELPAAMGIRDKRQSKVIAGLKEPVRWAKPNPQESQDPHYLVFRSKGGTLSYETWAKMMNIAVPKHNPKSWNRTSWTIGGSPPPPDWTVGLEDIQLTYPQALSLWRTDLPYLGRSGVDKLKELESEAEKDSRRATAQANRYDQTRQDGGGHKEPLEEGASLLREASKLHWNASAEFEEARQKLEAALGHEDELRSAYKRMRETPRSVEKVYGRSRTSYDNPDFLLAAKAYQRVFDWYTTLDKEHWTARGAGDNLTKQARALEEQAAILFAASQGRSRQFDTYIDK